MPRRRRVSTALLEKLWIVRKALRGFCAGGRRRGAQARFGGFLFRGLCDEFIQELRKPRDIVKARIQFRLDLEKN